MIDKNYSIHELVRSQSFRRMVTGTASPEEIAQWNRWIETNPKNRHKARKAIAEIAEFEFRTPDLPHVQEEWNKLYKTGAGRQFTPKLYRKLTRKKGAIQWIVRTAAVIILASSVSLGTYQYYQSSQDISRKEQLNEAQIITTGENEQKTLRFTDDSKIVLNSNSTLIYRTGSLRGETIQVTLDGEAYFEANGGASADRRPAFEVITPDGIIEDVGTKFLVIVDEDRSRVILQDGLVKIGQKSEKNSDGELHVKQGQMVEFTKNGIIKKQNVNSTFFTSWATGFIRFDQTKIQAFADYIKQRFDVQVQIIDASLADIEMDGAVYFRSLEDLVQAVSDVVKVPVYQSGDRDTIYIGNYQ